MIVLRKGVEELPVRLTDEEKMRAGVELAEARQGIARAKAEVKRLTTRLDELTDRITGYAREQVKVADVVEGDYVVTRRLDTLEPVRERRATEKELLQKELPLSGDALANKPFLPAEEIEAESRAANAKVIPPGTPPTDPDPTPKVLIEGDGDITAYPELPAVPESPEREPWDEDEVTP